MVQEDIYQRLTKVETKLEEHSKLLEKQQDRNNSQVELNTLLKIQIETSKEQSKQMEKFGDTLDRVNINLTNLNSKQELLDERVTGIEGNLSKQNLNLIDIIKYIGATGIGIAVAYLYVTLGL
ncbi:hypothetical protein [Bacillus sp. T33-2]|uniref:hypothetical protein n=1 Tax=Bacillus sp. T33-2 TaxID=2054168 RepID=UPI000C75BCAF|nr:hypothetical protein [Bacillus sp. T33-2]PLR99657.1 hypothetical protein CVD19_00935 [Bacillus sp. T33-2]